HAAACPDRGHSWRRGQPPRRVRRRLLDRLHLHVRVSAFPRSRLRHLVSADDHRDRLPAARTVWEIAGVTRILVQALVVAAVFAVLPFFLGDYYINLGSQIMIAAVFALSFNLLVGYAGLTSLGHAAFLGLAAYLVAWLTTRGGFDHGTAALAAIAGTTVVA